MHSVGWFPSGGGINAVILTAKYLLKCTQKLFFKKQKLLSQKMQILLSLRITVLNG